MSEPTPKLAAALAQVQAKLPTLERDREVTVEKKGGGTYSYSYVTLAELTRVILPLLAEHGLSFAAMPGAGSDGKMAVRYSLMHSSGEALTGEFPISGEGGIQMIGGRITYARRYCLAALVGIAADEDDESRLTDDRAPATAKRAQTPRQRQPAEQGGATVQRAAQPGPPLPGESGDGPRPVTKAQLTKIHTVYSRIGWEDRDDRLRAASVIVGRPVESSTTLTAAEAHDLIEALELVATAVDPAARLGELLTEIREREAPGVGR